MRYQLQSKAGRPHHIEHFLRRISTETSYEVIYRDDETATAIIEAEGPLPGFPPVTVEALPDS